MLVLLSSTLMAMGLDQAEEVLLTGSSAGGLAVYLHAGTNFRDKGHELTVGQKSHLHSFFRLRWYQSACYPVCGQVPGHPCFRLFLEPRQC